MTRSYEEKERIFRDVLARMKLHTWRSITQICGAFDEQTGELLGTGTFVNVRGSTYLLTAHHVAACLFASNLDGTRRYPAALCHSVGDSERMMYVTNPWVAWSQPKDLAVTRLDPVVLEGTDRVPVEPRVFAPNTSDLKDDIYFLHGFPGKRSRFTTFFGRGVMSTSLPYGGWFETSSWSGFDPAVHFAVTYPAQQIVDERGQPTDLPNPGGLSGSAVWKTNKAGTGSEWTPEHARIVGVAHRYDQSSQCLIVTRIEFVRGILVYLLRAEFAYFRWLQRGKPLWDDLDDWVAAEAAIQSLT